MNINPLASLPASLAGTAQGLSKGSEVDRTARGEAEKNRAEKAVHRAEVASDVGETDDDVETTDRDADGRQLWQRSAKQEMPDDLQQQPEMNDPHANGVVHVRDLTGEVGNVLDLEG